MSVKISGLPAGTTPTGPELIPGVQGGVTVSFQASQLSGTVRTTAETAAGVTPTNYRYLPGDIRRYGADPTNPDNGPAINSALRCNPLVFDGNTSGPVIYPVQTTIRFQCAGQIFSGAGGGDTNTAAVAGATFAPRTTLKWTGAAGGSVVSTSNRTISGVVTPVCFSETTLRDIFIDGNSLAQYGVEGFDDVLSSTSGCWRNKYVNVGVMNCTNGYATAFYQGNKTGTNGAPFANDNFFDNCYAWACARGIAGVMAVPQLHHCTIGAMTDAGIRMEGQGSEVKIFGGVFHANSWDIIANVGATGPIQNISAIGTWFENSSSGVMEALGSFNLQLIGCHLHTSQAAGMFNFNGQAGHATIKSWVSGTTASFNILGANATYDYDLIGTGSTVSGVKQQVRGLVNVDNAKFFVAPTAGASNVTGNGTAYNMNAWAVTRVSDLANAVNASTGVFTAPASGFYSFIVSLELTGVTASHNDAILNLVVTGTSAQVYLLDRRNPGTQLVTGSSEAHICGTIVVPMTAGDTAYPQINVNGSTQVVGVLSAGSAQNYRTFFQGKMA